MIIPGENFLNLKFIYLGLHIKLTTTLIQLLCRANKMLLNVNIIAPSRKIYNHRKSIEIN